MTTFDTTIVISPEERLAEILDSYFCELEEHGVPPDVEALVAAHPALAEEIRDYAESLQMLHRMTGAEPPRQAQDRRRASAGSLAGSAKTASTAVKQLGDFELLREIGRGGMGIVYEARQTSLNRHVALKVLPFAAVLDEQQIARFRTEAQAAAQLHHPNIVPVYAVGQERGVHFFAMQFVAGQSLEAAIADLRDTQTKPDDPAASQRDAQLASPSFSTKVSTRSRRYCESIARLGIQAAEALQHAHEFGVVHRDVKPSNLLVDRDGRLWITDFGLARIQAGTGMPVSRVTATGDVIGTARYMSPEQAAGNQALVDAASDVYSLGATLYELLTLEYCHQGESRQQLLTSIESVEPISPRRINSSIPTELETVVLHALAKQRHERYATAQDLADDLRRYLEGEPTHAQRPTALDRAAKWAVRRRGRVAVAAVMLAVVAAVSAMGAWQVGREQARTAAALIDAEQNLFRAEEHFAQARRAVDRFGSGVADQLAALPGSEPLRRALLIDAMSYYEDFMQHAFDDPALKYDVATASFQAAATAERLGDADQAKHRYAHSLQLFAALASEQPDDSRLPSHEAACHNNLGLLHAAAGDYDSALPAYLQAVEILSRTNDHPALAETYGNLGLLYHKMGQGSDAVARLQEAARLLGEIAAGEPDQPRHRHDLAIVYNNLSFVLRDSDLDGSHRANDQARDLLAELVASAPQQVEYLSDLAACWSNLGAIRGRQGDWEWAAAAHREAIELSRQLVRQATGVVSYRRDLIVGLNNLGQAQTLVSAPLAGDIVAGDSAFDEASMLARQLVGDFPRTLEFQHLLAGVLNNQAAALETAGHVAAALDGYREAIELQREVFESATNVAQYRAHLSQQYFNFGRALRAANQLAEARKVNAARRELEKLAAKP